MTTKHLSNLTTQIKMWEKDLKFSNEMKTQCKETQDIFEKLKENSEKLNEYIKNSKECMKLGYSDNTFPDGYFKGDLYKIIIDKIDTFENDILVFLKNNESYISELNANIQTAEEKIRALKQERLELNMTIK